MPARLSAAAVGAPVVHTDDFASADNLINWWPRLLAEVIEPLAVGRPARYQRYDWENKSLVEWHTLEPAPIVIIEGVSAARREWAERDPTRRRSDGIIDGTTGARAR